ncbi:MAG: hypothetical protein ACLSAF_10725 [Intestinimonas sp.]
MRARYGNEVMDRANARTAQLTQEQYWAMATLEGRSGPDWRPRSGPGPIRPGTWAGPGPAAQSLAFPLLGGALVQP